MNSKTRKTFITLAVIAGFLLTPLISHAQVVGGGCPPGEVPNPTNPTECIPAPSGTIPEPSILYLFGLGIVGIAVVRRFKNKK